MPQPNTIKILKSKTTNVYINQAIELALFDSVKLGELFIFLWANENTVVIGRNQNAYDECKAELLEREGGHLARRLSGGGAVFHDIGNLNFTFIARDCEYSQDKNFQIISTALKNCGFEVELSGRNDMTVSGKKFSGNAFYSDKEKKLHHGTILICTDSEKMKKYLTPSLLKRAKHSVKSVESRVINLSDLNKSFNREQAENAIIAAIKTIFYGADIEEITSGEIDGKMLDNNLAKFSSQRWIYGTDLCYNRQCEIETQNALFCIKVFVSGGIIKSAKVFTDSLDFSAAQNLEEKLVGIKTNEKTDDSEVALVLSKLEENLV